MSMQDHAEVWGRVGDTLWEARCHAADVNLSFADTYSPLARMCWELQREYQEQERRNQEK